MKLSIRKETAAPAEPEFEFWLEESQGEVHIKCQRKDQREQLVGYFNIDDNGEIVLRLAGLCNSETEGIGKIRGSNRIKVL